MFVGGIDVIEDTLERSPVNIDGRAVDSVALIGMDVLRACQFYIDGIDKRFVLTTFGVVPRSHQPQPFKAGVALPPNNNMIVHGDPERLSGLHDQSCHINVRFRRRWIAAWMIVDQYDRRR